MEIIYIVPFQILLFAQSGNEIKIATYCVSLERKYSACKEFFFNKYFCKSQLQHNNNIILHTFLFAHTLLYPTTPQTTTKNQEAESNKSHEEK